MEERAEEISGALENISLGDVIRYLNNRKLNYNNFEKKNYLFGVYWHN